MNKKYSPHRGWKISDMASHIPAESISRVEPIGDGAVDFSPQRIKELALHKRRDALNMDIINRKEEKRMKKWSFKLLVAAVMICILSVGAFAALDGFGYIRSIFGESADSIQNAVVTPYLSEKDEGREMALEAVVTDGFVTNLVVSLTGDAPQEQDLFQVDSGASTRSIGWYLMEEFSTPEKSYYAIELVEETRFESAAVTVALNKEIAAITLSFRVNNSLGHTAVVFPEGAKSGDVALEELQVSPMGFLLRGIEDDAKGGLPATNIRLVFADGTTEDIQAEFDVSEATVAGGGGVILGGGDDMPLAAAFNGTRNPDGELVITGQFSRIIDASSIEKVIIDGVEYRI